MEVDAIIVGGGIAGLQAALQLGRYMHRIAVIDGGEGRSKRCRRYGNLLGWPNGVSGEALRLSGRLQTEKLGVRFIEGIAETAEKKDGTFIVRLRHDTYEPVMGTVMLLATGVLDRCAPIDGVDRCFGISVYVCPDCDGYEARNRRTVIMGAGHAGAHMALAVSYWTDRIIYINHEKSPIDPALVEQLETKSIQVVNEEIEAVESSEEGMISAVKLRSGGRIEAERAFIAFGGNEVRTELAAQLGAERMESGHLITDPRTKMTSVSGLWAAGDIGIHSEMVTAAMAEGSLSAVWMHKELLKLGKHAANDVLIVR